jgi:hypothetical protein
MKSIIVGAIISLVTAFLYDEITGWMPGLAKFLVRRSACRLHGKDRSRYHEEWAAHLDQLPTKGAKLWMALSVMIAAERMRAPLASRLRKAWGKIVGAALIVYLLPALVTFGFLAALINDGPAILRTPIRLRSGKLIVWYRFNTGPLDQAPRGHINTLVRLSKFDLLLNLIHVAMGNLQLSARNRGGHTLAEITANVALLDK